MAKMTMLKVKSVAHSDEYRELSPNVAFMLSSTEPFIFFQLIFWFHDQQLLSSEGS